MSALLGNATAQEPDQVGVIQAPTSLISSPIP